MGKVLRPAAVGAPGINEGGHRAGADEGFLNCAASDGKIRERSTSCLTNNLNLAVCAKDGEDRNEASTYDRLPILVPCGEVA